jgi:hypothetical protein
MLQRHPESFETLRHRSRRWPRRGGAVFGWMEIDRNAGVLLIPAPGQPFDHQLQAVPVVFGDVGETAEKPLFEHSPARDPVASNDKNVVG